MDKVEWLKRIYEKLTGKKLVDPSADTVCEVLHHLGDDLGTANVSSQFELIASDDTNAMIGDYTASVKRDGNVYRVLIYAKVTLAADTSASYLSPFKIVMNGVDNFGGANATCLAIKPASGEAIVGVLQVGGSNDETHNTMAYLAKSLTAGEYDFNVDFTFIV